MESLISFLYKSWPFILGIEALFGIIEFFFNEEKFKEYISRSPHKEIATLMVIIAFISAYVALVYTSVPNVVGLKCDTAVSNLRNADLDGRLIPTIEYDEDRQICSQSIAAGTIVKKGEAVVLSYDKQPGIYEEAKYEMEVYVTQEAYEPYRRNFRDYSVQGTNEVYSTRDTYGEKHITFTVTEDQLAQAAVYSPGATIPEDNSGMYVGGINMSDKDAYVMQIPLYDGRYYPLFIKAKIG